MTIRSHVLIAVFAGLLAAAAGCGGKKGSTLPDETGDSDLSSHPPSSGGGGGVIVPPETADDIQRRFERKRTPISRCLSAAVDAKELPKNSHGKITLNVTVEPNGKAGDVKIVKATIESPMLTSCVIAKVKEIIFPEVPKPYPTSYTYGFEAM